MSDKLAVDAPTMAFDERLADRIRGSLGRRKGLVEKKMFGGVAFLLNGNMCVGVHKSDLIVRLAPEATDAALARAHTRRFDLTGRPMKGWILVEQGGLKTDAQLSKWVQVAAKYAGSLPAKRSEEHTSELQSRGHLVCRLLLEK